MTVIHGDEVATRHKVMKVTCDFCGKKMKNEFDDRGFIFLRFDSDSYHSHDGCDACLTEIHEEIKRKLR